MYIVALVAGVIVAAILLGIFRKKTSARLIALSL